MTYNIFNEQAYSPRLGYLYDGFPGSSFNPEIEYEPSYSDNGLFYDFECDFKVTDRIMFIPTASALNIFEESPFTYKKNYYINPPRPNIDCPFDAYALPDSMEGHIDISDPIFEWLVRQINMKINGPTYVSSIANYSTTGYTGPLNWSTSNNAIAIIDNSGKLTATGDGKVTITAEYYSDGKLYRKSRDVVVNFPDIIITNSYAAGNGYRFTVNCIDHDSDVLLDELVSAGTLQYEWTLLDADGNRTTSVSSSDSIVFLPKGDEVITVAVRLVDTSGRKGRLKSESFDLRTPMSMNYRYVIVDSQQNVYYIKEDNTYEVGLPSEDMAAIFRNIPMNTGDSILSDEVRQKYLKGRDCYISYPYGLRMTGYIQGVPSLGYTKWSFDFFDSAMFMDSLVTALTRAGGEEREMTDFYLTLCNSEQEPLQDILIAAL